jgi:hypothetical protein
MGIKQKIKHWYTKPRSGVLFGFSDWVLNSPDAMNILLYMSYLFAVVAIGIIWVLIMIFSEALWSKILFGVMFLVSANNLRNHIKTNKVLEGKAINFSMNEFLYEKKKKEKKKRWWNKLLKKN